MQKWFYEMYGFYPLELDNGVFYIGNVKYELVLILEEEAWDVYLQVLAQVQKAYSFQQVTIIKNKQQSYISIYQDMQYVLVAGSTMPLQPAALFVLHAASVQKEMIPILEMKSKWIARVDQLEYEILPWIPTNMLEYERVMICGYVALGLAENAIMYLSELNVAAMQPMCICNKRLDELTNWSLMNPTRMVFDHAGRDIAELVKRHWMSHQELLAYIQKVGWNESDISYFIARLLFPFTFFDCLEKIYTEQQSDLCMDLQEFEMHTKELLVLIRFLMVQYSLRPIEWILRT